VSPAAITPLHPATHPHHGATATRVLPDRFDVHEVPAFRHDLTDALTGGDLVVVVDASAVRFLDATAIDALVSARLQCREQGGELILAAPSPAARIVLELAGRYEACNPIEIDDVTMAVAA